MPCAAIAPEAALGSRVGGKSTIRLRARMITNVRVPVAGRRQYRGWTAQPLQFYRMPLTKRGNTYVGRYDLSSRLFRAQRA